MKKLQPRTGWYKLFPRSLGRDRVRITVALANGKYLTRMYDIRRLVIGWELTDIQNPKRKYWVQPEVSDEWQCTCADSQRRACKHVQAMKAVWQEVKDEN